MKETFDEWVEAYIAAQSNQSTVGDTCHPDWWAIQEALFRSLDSSVDSREEVWRFILAVIERSSNERVLQMLAAGPLEDFIYRHGRQYIDLNEAQARRDPKFRDTLGGVWRSQTPIDVWTRIEAARGEPL